MIMLNNCVRCLSDFCMVYDVRIFFYKFVIVIVWVFFWLKKRLCVNGESLDVIFCIVFSSIFLIGMFIFVNIW